VGDDELVDEWDDERLKRLGRFVRLRAQVVRPTVSEASAVLAEFLAREAIASAASGLTNATES